MDQVKFNRGQRSVIEASQTLTTNEISLARESASGNDWNSIYLGTYLVGTSMLGLMKPQMMIEPVYTTGSTPTIDWANSTTATIGGVSGNLTSAVVTADWNGTSALTTCRRLVNATEASSSGYTANDSEILTAAAAAALVTSAGGYYTDGSGTTAGGWDYQSAGWNTWTAVHSIDTTKNISFTLPVESNNIVKHGTSPNEDYSDELLPTSKAVATFVTDYFAGLAGGMRYEGSIASTTVPADSKSGDVFIASQAFTIGTAPDTISVEAGDMIVLNSTYSATAGQTGTLTTTNCDVFERNIDGAITGTLTTSKFVVASGAHTIQTADVVFDTVVAGNRSDKITVTHYIDNVAGTPFDITIDDVYHAKYVDVKQDNTPNSFKDVLIDGTHSNDTTNHDTYQAPKRTSNVQINPAAGEIQLNYTASGAQTATTILVGDALSWHDL